MSDPRFRLSLPTVALALAGLLALAAIAVALLRPGDAPATPETAQQQGGEAGTAGGIAAMAERMEERLRQDPDNHEAWFLLGLTRREMTDLVAAERAFRRAHELAPRNADYAAHLGEALLLTGRENPPLEAERLFRRALEAEPGHAQSRYYLATIKDLGGDHRGAIDDLVALLRDAPADAEWVGQVRAAAEAIARNNGIDLAGRLPPPPAASSATAAIPGPSREQMEAARGIPPAAQQEMVRGMVDGLAERLRRNPRDAEGWIRLMRSRMVLGERDAAAQALRDGLAAFQGDPATQAQLRAAAGQLGISG